MAYDNFTILRSSAVPLPIENVDTDQIIPARFLKATERKGFGDNLFRDWRYNTDGTPKKDFILNNPVYSGKILVAGRNFGSFKESLGARPWLKRQIKGSLRRLRKIFEEQPERPLARAGVAGYEPLKAARYGSGV